MRIFTARVVFVCFNKKLKKKYGYKDRISFLKGKSYTYSLLGVVCS